MDNKPQIIFNQRLCGFLMQKGFVLMDMRPDTNGSGRNVFFFKNTKELHEAIAEYKALQEM